MEPHVKSVNSPFKYAIQPQQCVPKMFTLDELFVGEIRVELLELHHVGEHVLQHVLRVLNTRIFNILCRNQH